MNTDGVNKKVYVGMVADILHHGHINILVIAHSKGDVTVGLLTDEAVSTYKRTPIVPFKHRKEVISSIRYVKDVVPQNTLDYTENLLLLKPDIVVHGSDWRTGSQQKTRKKVIDTLSEWGGMLVEPDYTRGISTSDIIEKIKNGYTD
tara:strand:+ start:1770 stop:2210 length:441 start_codon:yes stop_codon:yes gene_type:complete